MSEELTQAKGQEVEVASKGPKRFVEKGPHVIYDSVTGVFWHKKDSWQEKGKFYNWHESRDYASNKNARKAGGFNDWRLPTVDEAASLYDEKFNNPGKGGQDLHIDPIFPEGAFKVVWVAGDTSTRRPRFDYVQGKVASADEYSFGAVRICRKDAVRKYQKMPVRS